MSSTGRAVLCEVPLEELERAKSFRFSEGTKEVLVLHTEAGPRAYSGVCPHLGGPLLEAKLEKGGVFCPWHNYRFEAATGRCGHRSDIELKPLPFEVSGGRVRVFDFE